MIKSVEEPAADRRPHRFFLYAVFFLGVISGLLTAPACQCTWPQLLLAKAGAIIFCTGFWSIVVIAGYHGYHFVKSLFRHPG